MKKLSFKCIICLLLVIGLISASVSAATITNVYVTDTQNATVLIKGNTQVTSEIINTSIFGLKPGKDLADFDILTNSDFILTEAVASENDGSFEVEFSMGASGNGEYKIHTIDEKAGTADATLIFYTSTEIDGFLGTVETSKETLKTKVQTYAQSIGLNGTNLDLAVFDTEYLDMFVENLWAIKSLGSITMENLFDVYEDSIIEMNFLKEIKSVTLQQQIKTVMDKSEYASVLAQSYTGLVLDTAGYNALGQGSLYQTAVLDTVKLLSAGYNSSKDFVTAFNSAVTTQTSAKNQAGQQGGVVIVPGGTVGGGGTTGGGGGGVGGAPAWDVSGVGQGATSNKYFDDLANVSWAVESINALAEKNIVTGVAPRLFDPEANLTREAFTKMIVLALKKYNAAAKADFTDASSGNWYDSYIASAKDSGLINGLGDGTFGVGQNITRQDLAVILYKAALKQGRVFTSKKTFGDDYQIADYAKEAVSYLAGEGIISGMGDNIFAPTANATRAQAAKLIYSLIK